MPSARFPLRSVLLLLCALGLSAGCRKSPPPRPNVLIITVDTLRADRLGTYGHSGGLTPSVDALARDGVIFERAIAQVPLTWPSHAAIFTGTYPFHNGVQDFTGQPLSTRFRTLAESFHAGSYATGAIVSSFVLDRGWGLARGFESYDDAFAGQEFLQKNLALVERRAGESVDHAIAWLDTHTKTGQPFFLWLHLYDPHSPYNPPEPFRTQYAKQPYDGEIAYADSQLARLFAWLKQPPHDVYGGTVIVFLSDHGESLGEHGEREHGFFVYDSTVRVPLIVKPAQTAPRPAPRVADAVETIQVGPTVLDLAGLTDPIQEQFQASSLLPLLTGLPHDPQRAAYSETLYPANSFGWSALRSIQTSRYHFIEAPRQELYEHSSDPAEKTNVAGKDAAIASRMRAQIAQMLATYAAPAAPSGGNTTGASPEVLEKLRSLGYVAYKAPATAGSKLADPKDKLSTYQDVLRATDLIQAGNFPAARVLLARLERSESNLYLIPFLLGEAASHLAQWKEAEKQFGRAAALNPGFDQARTGLARALGLQGKTTPARELIGTLLAENPRNFRAWYLLAQIQAQKDPRASREALDKVLAIQPNFAPAFRDRGLLSVNEGTFVSAAEDLGRAAALGMRDPLTYNSLGICYSRMNRLDDAAENYRRALEADPAFAQAHLNLGFVYERMNQPVMAKQEYAAACRLDRRLCSLIANRK